MSRNAPTPSASLRERAIDSGGGPDKLPKWLGVSLLLHGVFIVVLFLMPYWPRRTIVPPPVYTVDLVGGERIGGNNLATEFLPKPAPKPPTHSATPAPPPPPPPRKPKKEAEAELPSPAPDIKKQTKVEAIKKPVQTQKEKVKVKAPPEEKVVAKSPPKKEAVKKKGTAEKKKASATAKQTPTETKTDEASLERVRERLIQSAVEQVKNRTEALQKSPKEGVVSAGKGEGLGSASIGSGPPGGGGIVKGIEFIAYQNQMLSTIKANWAWVGQSNNLRVVVQFHIREDGDIDRLKIVQPSGDPSYDESVLRAVTKSSPLPPPPESYRKDFSEIKITFRPKDLGA